MHIDGSRWRYHSGDHPVLLPSRSIQSNWRDGERRLRCLDVARNRAIRYARRHRIAKPLRPLIVAVILVSLIFERSRWLELVRLPKKLDNARGTPDYVPDVAHAEPGVAEEDEYVSGDWSEPRNKPPTSFLSRDAAQAMAFLIRNRGRLDNEVVREKWNIVDRFSLSTAIYLREVEARGAWDDLEREISEAALGSPAGSSGAVPKSPRHRKILRLAADWSPRGEELLATINTPETCTAPVPEIGDDPLGGNTWKP